MRNRLFLVFICLVLVQNFVSARDYNERYYQTKWCKQWGGIQEYKLVDSTRVDCLTQHYAVEFDFAKKWAEGIGQCLYYGLRTGKKPALVLIVENPND